MYLGACNVEQWYALVAIFLSFCHRDTKWLNGRVEEDLIGIILAKG